MLVYKDGHVTELKNYFPNTSFPPEGPNDAFLNENNLYKVAMFKEHNPVTEKLVNCDPYIEGNTAYTVIVEQKTQEEMDLDTESEKISVRSRRNELLQVSDWTQIPDCTVDKEAWAAYRNELRNVTDQPGFPWNIEWPKAPNWQPLPGTE